jgi:hypothetical protein
LSLLTDFIEIWTQSDVVYDWMARCRVPNTTAKTRVMSNLPMEVNGMAWCSVTANMDKRSSEKPPTMRKSFTNNVSTRSKPRCRTVSCIGGWTQETRQEKAQASLWKYVLDITLGYSSYLYVLVTYYVTYLWNEKGALLCLKIPKCDSKWTGTVVAPCRTYRRCCKGGWKAFTCHSSPRSSQLLSKLL